MADRDFSDDFDRDLNALEIGLSAAATKSSLTLEQFIRQLQAQGMSDGAIEGLLLDDLTNGGRIFGEIRNSFKSTVSGAYGAVANRAAHKKFYEDFYDSEGDVQPEFVWIAALVNTCPDCLPRHSQKQMYDTWIELGLPKAGWSVCRGHCQCQLIPFKAAASRKELEKPIIRERRAARLAKRAATPGTSGVGISDELQRFRLDKLTK